MNFCTVGRISVSEIFKSPKILKWAGNFAYKILLKISMFRLISCLGSPTSLFECFRRGKNLCTVGRISVPREQFVYCGKNFCTAGRILYCGNNFRAAGRISELWEEFLYCGKNFVLWEEFCSAGRISVLWEEFLYCRKKFCTLERISALRG